jgi:hypothetical protein
MGDESGGGPRYLLSETRPSKMRFFCRQNGGFSPFASDIICYIFIGMAQNHALKTVDDLVRSHQIKKANKEVIWAKGGFGL